MNSFKIQGTLIKKSDVMQVTPTFQMSIFAIEIEGRFPQKIKFQLTQDRSDLILPYILGQEVIVHFDIRGNETNEGKIFNNLDAWRIEPVGGYQPSPPRPQNTPSNEPQGNGFPKDPVKVDQDSGEPVNSGSNDFEDLPF